MKYNISLEKPRKKYIFLKKFWGRKIFINMKILELKNLAFEIENIYFQCQ